MALYHDTSNGPTEVKHINYGTAVGYSKIGSPTVSNGVVSGLTDSNYLVTNSSADFSTVTEFVMKVKTPAAKPSVGTYIFCGLSSSTKANLLLNDNAFFLSANGISLLVFKIGYEVNTWYWLKYTNDGTTQKAYYSTDGINYTLNATQTNTVISSTGAVLYFGRTAWGAPDQYSFGGSIDLNHSYIKVNGTLWFYHPATNYLVKDGKLIWADSGLYLYGPVNYTLTGTPTITDGIVSNFLGRSSYMGVSQSLTYNSNSNVHVHIRFKTSTLTATGRNPIIQCNNRGGSSWLYTYSTEFYCLPASGHGGAMGYPNMQSNTWYVADVTISNNQTVCNLYDDNDTLLASKTWETTFSDVTHKFYFGMQYGYQDLDLPVVNCVDLTNTYIEVDGNLWFYGKNYATKNIAPVPAGYTYGTTTTSAIGYVDMRTQAFTAAPSGATIGRDE